MPRPKGPKPIRSLNSNKRVAKPAGSPHSQPLSQRNESTKNRDNAVQSPKRKSGIYPGKENIIDSSHRKGGSTKEVTAIIQNSSLRQKKAAPVRSPPVKAASVVNSRPGTKHASSVADSSEPALESASAFERGRRLQKRSNLAESSSRATSQAYRPQATPLGHSSVLGALKFKKRARQPSLLQVAQSQQDTTIDIDEIDFLDLRPDDESTPLVKSSFENRKAPLSRSSTSQQSRKRKLGDSGLDILEIQSQRSSQSVASDEISAPDDSFDLPADVEGEGMDEPELPRPSARRMRSPAQLSDSQAPPRSSSSSAESIPRTSRAKTDQRNANADDSLPLFSSPLSTERRATTKKPKKSLVPPTPPTTARLQHLLPRRRTRLKTQSTFDIPSSSDIELDASGLAEDEDELSFHATSKMRRTKAKGHKSMISKRRPTKGKQQGEEQELKRKRASTTYTRKVDYDSNSGNENDDTLDTADTSIEIDEETGKVVPVLHSKAKVEMKRLAEKFKEIDDFDMEFEDVTGSSSQMHDAR